MDNMIKAQIKDILMDECKLSASKCLYISTDLHKSITRLIFLKRTFIVSPIFLGILCILLPSTFCGLLAGVLPIVYSALEVEQDLPLMREKVLEFDILHDRFHQCHLITSTGTFEDFNSEYLRLTSIFTAELRESIFFLPEMDVPNIMNR